jgi:glycosyltransferase involved in cell wall biosynthesis
MLRPVLNRFRNLMQRVDRRVSMLSAVHETVIELTPKGEGKSQGKSQAESQVKGRVLLAYIIDPFLLADGAAPSNAHTHHWESWQIAQSFLDRGYAVDVISYQNQWFVPRKSYDVLFAARTNFHRLALAMPPHCRKVVHLDTAHWLFNNTAAYRRLLDVQQRRKVTLYNPKMVEVNWAIEHADLCTVLGNDFTLDTYRFANKPLHRVLISAPEVYDYPEARDIGTARQHFMWFGSSGFVHKGLDLVLEAFAGMPDCHLHVCGPFADEPEFMQAFHDEMFNHPNIHAEGWVDVASERFRELCRQSIAVVYPSASEGGGGSVISCMHGGLIPVVSRETSVDIGEFGLQIGGFTVEAVRSSVRDLLALPADELDRRARAAWNHARNRHTRASFKTSLEAFLDGVLRL